MRKGMGSWDGRFAALGSVVAVGLISGCSSSSPTGPTPPPTPASSIVITAGNAQTALAGEPVASAPRVRVRNAEGQGIPGVVVSFVIVSGGGSVEVPTDTTDATGTASSGVWTLGAQIGTQQLRATATGMGSATFTAVATVGAPAGMTVARGDGQSAEVGSQVATAPAVTVRDAGANPVAGVTVTFAVTAGGGSITGPTATTGADGVAEVGSWTLGTAAGENRLQAAAPGVTPVAVTATGVAGPPTAATMHAGDGQTATVETPVAVAPAVRVADAHGNPVSGVSVAFAVTSGGGSATETLAATDSTGVAAVGSWTLGPALGQNTLEAAVAAAGVAASPVTFVATGVAGGGSAYDIEVRYNAGSSPTGAQASAFASAESRWESVIVGDLPPVSVDRPAGTCSSPDPISETIDDLVIFVTLEAIDGPGGVLGSAGPCLIRSGSLLPVGGSMRFDTADLATLQASGLLDDVILHEMGHVLGIGTLWGSLGFLADPAASGGLDPHFTGPEAIGAFDAIGGAGYGGPKVPVEAGGGPGTHDGHWRESVFDRELMTGWIDAGSNPLSLVTVESLEDIGYAVDAGEADGFSVSVSTLIAPRPGVSATLFKLEGDILRLPIDVLDPHGSVVRRIPR